MDLVSLANPTTQWDKAMKQVSMKSDSGHGDGCKCCHGVPDGCGEPDYPWGLRITLTEREIADLGIKSLPAAGAPVGIEATCRVIGVGEEEREGKTERRIELQITDLALAAAGTNKYAKIYDGDPSMKD